MFLPLAGLSPLRSFWMAGFEGADHVNGSGVPLSMGEATQHDRLAANDYARLAFFDIRTVRESVGWRLADDDGRYDFSLLEKRLCAARVHGMQIVWTLCHYGWPRDLDLFSEAFVERFARFAGAVSSFISSRSVGPGIYAPLNEISFLAWAVCETGLMHPYRGELRERGFALKQHLVRATLAACDAIWKVDPHARMLHVDPVIHIVAPADQPQLASAAARQRSFQFQAWDMLCGAAEPQLGGHPRYLDLIGVNYYHGNQWEHGSDRRLHWHLRDPRRVPLAGLLGEVHRRYERPLVVAETSHVGAGRGAWIREIADEVSAARGAGVPVAGICLYPIIDRPDWENPAHWHHSGLWDLEADAGGTLARRLDVRYAEDLRIAQRQMNLDRRAVRAPLSWGSNMNALVVFSHLRWDFVFQRPQQLLSRLARDWRILFVEEPVYDERAPFAEVLTPAPNVQVLRPHTPVRAAGFHDDQLPMLRELLRNIITSEAYVDYGAWLYTPMALPLLQQLEPRVLVYDCMDELANFRNAPRQLVQRESALMKMANLVFTGGPSLYEAKRSRHPAVHCFPSSVDVAHFAVGRDARASHRLLAHLPRPRLGFFGVIDERFDADLIRVVAERRPHWHLCLVGPVVKIDPAQLPQRANIHYFPQQPYAELPQFLAGWDVCLMPFALNDATRFISPTKTLEYMAAERPIVATPVPDVASLYRDTVEIAGEADGFIAACERMLAEDPATAASRRAAMARITSATSWDRTAGAMRELIAAAAQEGPTPDALDMLREHPGAAQSARSARRPAVHAECLVLGAGPTGLSAAYHYGAASLVLERNAHVGGWCRSIGDRGFTFDYAGHIMFSNDPYVHELYRKLLGDNVHWQDREAWIFSNNVYTRYPFQGALHGLPPQVLKECIVGAIEARFGSLQQLAKSPSAQGDGSPAATDCCADGLAESTVRALSGGTAPPGNFEEFIYRTWGAGIAKHFALPYNSKLWTVPLAEMETSWLGGRVPLPDLEQMIEGALSPVPRPVGPNARFGYPLRGGFQALMEGFLPHLQGELELNAEVVSVSPGARIVTLRDGRTFRYDTLVSTLPLPRLVKAIGDEAPADVVQAARALRHVSVRCVNLGIGRGALTDKHWIYFPEDTVFHRIFVQGNASPHCNPPGGFGLTCEISYSPSKPLPVDGTALIERCIEECIRVGIIGAQDPILTANQVDMPYAYVVYDHARNENVQRIRNWLAPHGIVLAGRYSEWEYYNSDHAFLAGRRAADAARALVEDQRMEARSA